MITSRAILMAVFFLLVGFGLGYFLGGYFASSSHGAYFCCDPDAPCHLSTDGDCSTPLKWCSKIKKLEDGTVTCVEW